MRENIDKLIAEATLSGNKDYVSVLRLIKSSFTNYEKEGKVLDDAAEVKILLKMKTQREDSIEQFKKAGRNDLVENEKKELEIIQSFIPEQPSDEEIKDYTRKICSEYEKIEMRHTKEVLQKVNEKYPSVSGKTVSEVIREFIGK